MPNLDPDQWLRRLEEDHKRELPALKNLNAHHEGTMQLNYLHPELLAELEDRIQQVVINWPELVVDCLDERLDLMYYRIHGKAKADAGLGEIWQYNDLDDLSQQAHVEALVMRRSFAIVGSRGEDQDREENQGVPDDMPLITVESPLEVHAEWDAGTREVAAAYKCWDERGADGKKIEHATLYLPKQTLWYVKESGEWALDPEHDPDEHNLGVVPVVPIVNRPRIRKPGGKSELDSIIPISNAANKIATDMMVTAEYHAAPRRAAFGFGEEDFVDPQGRKLSTWSRIIGRIWATEKTKVEGADVVQFKEADLKNFHDTINLLAHIVCSLGALPPAYAGFATDNPASADAIRSSESRLVKRAERRQKSFGNSWERTMRIADRIRSGAWRAELRRLESIWRNAATPTVAQGADAAVKLYTTKPKPIVPLRQTREDLGYNDEQIKLMEAEDAKAEASDPLNQIARGIADPAGEPETDAETELVTADGGTA